MSSLLYIIGVRRRTFYFIMAMMTLHFTIAMGQDRIVTGKVTDEKGDPLVGVNILIKGTLVGTVTDIQGGFSTPVFGDSTELLFTFIGYHSHEIRVGHQSTVEVKMEPSQNLLSEVVIVGYGVQEKKDITGSISSLNSTEINEIPTSNLENNFQGRIAGVHVISSGQPGAIPQITIRGTSTFAGSSQPLYVVDGIPTLDISTINPFDVESVTALKDAGAASIYGSRAGNGVIMITTKKGDTESLKLTYSGYYGIQLPGKGITNLLDPQGIADLTWLAYKNSGLTPPSDMYGNGPTPVVPEYYRPAGKFEGEVDENTYHLQTNPITRTNKKGTNWYEEMTEVAPIQNHDIAVSGGSSNSKYYVGLNYFNQDGIVIFTGAKRYSMRINTEFKIRNKIRVGENISTTYRSNAGISNSSIMGGGPTTIADCYLTPVILPVYDIAGNFAFQNPSQRNPYATQFLSKDNKSYSIRTFGNIYTEMDFLKNFTLRTSFGGSFQYGHSYTFNPPLPGIQNSFTEGSFDEADWNWQNILTFRKKLKQHSLYALAGMEAIKVDMGRSIGGTRKGYFSENPDFWTLSGGDATDQTNYGFRKTPSSLLGFFGRLDYGFRNRYLLSLTVRRDGSSKFIGNRYGTFPAVTIAWHISEESFLQSSTFFNDLKIRAGWGIMGDQINASSTNSYSTFISDPGATYYDIGGSNNSSVLGFGKGFTGNPNGQWQENETINLGIDFSFFNNKFFGSLDTYKKITDKLLYPSEDPGTNGTASPASRNVGKMENKGIDLTLNYKADVGNAFKFNSTLTFTTYRNKVIKIANNVPYFEANNDIVRIQAGQAISSFYGYQIEGLWQSSEEIDAANAIDGNVATVFQTDAAPGRFRYNDINNDGIITSLDDRTFIGNPNPDFTYGLNLFFGYKHFDLSLFFYGVQGNDLYFYAKRDLNFFSSPFGKSKSTDLLKKSWTPENPNTTIPIAEVSANFSNVGVPNSYALEDGSYLRLRTIQIGYTVPNSVLAKAGIGSVRFYMQAINLFTVTNYSGLDPEVVGSTISFGVDGSIYPSAKQFIAGLNVQF